MYGIDVNPEARIVRAHLSGFFTTEEVAAFGRDEQAAAASLGAGLSFGLLLVSTDAMAQSQDVVAAFRGLFYDLPIKATRIAVVTQSVLLTMQLRRMADPARTRVFTDQSAASRWLAETPYRAAAAA